MTRQFRMSNGNFRKERVYAAFRGTMRYVSLSVHERKEQVNEHSCSPSPLETSRRPYAGPGGRSVERVLHAGRAGRRLTTVADDHRSRRDLQDEEGIDLRQSVQVWMHLTAVETYRGFRHSSGTSRVASRRSRCCFAASATRRFRTTLNSSPR